MRIGAIAISEAARAACGVLHVVSYAPAPPSPRESPLIDPVALTSDLIRISIPSGDDDGMREVQQHAAGLILGHVTEARIRTGGEDRPWTLISVGPDVPHAVLRLAEALGPALESVPLRHDEVLGSETASIGTFHGGDATNIVPSAATATLDQRTVDTAPVTYFTDGSVLQGFRPDVPIVVQGPGDPAQMHSVDERLELAQLAQAGDQFERVLLSGR